MTIEIKCETPLSDYHKKAVSRFVAGGRHVDHNRQFLMVDDEARTVRTLAAVHLTAEPKIPSQENAPYPWAGQGFPFDPFITFEDAEGNLCGFQHCTASVEYIHTYGALVHSDESGETWLFVLECDAPDGGASVGSESEITAEAVRAGRFSPIRIYGETEDFRTENASLTELDGCHTGEFCYSKEDEPKLVSSPWMSKVGEFAPGFGSEEARAADAALIGALHDRIRADKEASPGLG